MRGPASSRPERAEGPRPFSSEWLATDPALEAPARRRFAFPQWVPDGRVLSAVLVVLVALATAFAAFRGDGGDTLEATVELNPVMSLDVPVADPTASLPLTPEAAALAVATATALLTVPVASPEVPTTIAIMASPTAEPRQPLLADAPLDTPLLPEYRIVTYYGHPHDPNMGIVGEMTMEELASELRKEAENYAMADPARPVIPGFELIATVAQRTPGSDGTYILDTDHDTLQSYIDYAREQGFIVLLDLQIGRGTVAAEIEKVRDLLAQPNVHLALDPEFAVAEGETPGEYIGSITADDVMYAQQVLAEISAQNGIPPKMLVVHQFREDMIQGKELLAPMPGVQLVIDADGYGAPELKTAVYNFLVRDEPVEYAGVKLFYRQDDPLMTAEEILALEPSPDLIIFQ